jgi:hypothetical protein
MIEAPVGGRQGKGAQHQWNRSGVRLVRVVRLLDRNTRKGGPFGSRGSLLGIDWSALRALVRSHTSAGWLVIADDGAMVWAESAAEAVEAQTASRLAVCVRVDAA